MVGLLAKLCKCGRTEQGPLQRVITSILPLFVEKVVDANWAGLRKVAQGCAPEGLHRLVLVGLLAADHFVSTPKLFHVAACGQCMHVKT